MQSIRTHDVVETNQRISSKAQISGIFQKEQKGQYDWDNMRVEERDWRGRQGPDLTEVHFKLCKPFRFYSKCNSSNQRV